MPMYPNPEEYDDHIGVWQPVGSGVWRYHALAAMASVISDVGGLHEERSMEVSRALLAEMDGEWGWLDKMYLGSLAQRMISKVAGQ